MFCDEKDQATYDQDFLNKINASGIAPHRLILKPGACIILIRNMSVGMGHCNGTRYIVINVGLKRFPVRQYRRHKVSTSSESSVSSTGNILNHLGVRIVKPGTKQALHIPTV